MGSYNTLAKACRPTEFEMRLLQFSKNAINRLTFLFDLLKGSKIMKRRYTYGFITHEKNVIKNKYLKQNKEYKSNAMFYV